MSQGRDNRLDQFMALFLTVEVEFLNQFPGTAKNLKLILSISG